MVGVRFGIGIANRYYTQCHNMHAHVKVQRMCLTNNGISSELGASGDFTSWFLVVL